MQQKINIGFDAKRAFENFTGLGNYSRTLLTTLAEHCPEFNLHLFAPKRKDTPRTHAFLQKPFHPHFPDSSFTKYWRTKGVIKDLLKQNIEIYHGLSHEIPVGIEKKKSNPLLPFTILYLKNTPSNLNHGTDGFMKKNSALLVNEQIA